MLVVIVVNLTEFTTMAGRRLRDAMKTVLSADKSLDSIEDSLVQSQFSTKTPFNNEHTPLFFEPENQNGDNKIQPYELLTEDLDTVLAVSDEQKDIITNINNDRDVRLDFDFIFIVPNLVRSSYFTLARFTPTFTAPWMKTTVNMTSITWLQHLVLLFDPGGNFNVQEPNTTNRVPAPPPKPPDRSYYNVSIPCYVQMPMNYEDNHQVGFLKQSGLNIRTIASTDDLVWVHDHHLLAFSLKHTQSKLIKNVDLMRPLFFAKEAILLVTFFVNVERLTGYYSIGCYDKTMSIMLTLTCSDTLCSNCLRLRSYNNSIVQYYQVHINGLEAHTTNLITILGDYIEALIVQFIKVIVLLN
ncbi:hypothetical protein P8452_41428 [Trifolium repens]|nr:hypothetical protein P8452_41428 [Trifolium repens]